MDNTAITYLHTDHLATPRKATNEAGQVVWQWESEAFGNALPDSSGVEVNLRFPGQYYDQETGLYYNYFRYYDPSTGRYITSDPIGLYGGLNTYGYVGGNPINYFDPTGQCPWCVAAGVGAGVAAGLNIAEQLARNGGNPECIDWGEVAAAAAAGALLSGLGPTGFLLGRGGKRAANFGYSRSAGFLNRGNRRVGWSGPKNGRDVPSVRVGKRHYDGPYGPRSGAKPARDGAASGAAGAAANGGDGSGCDDGC